MIIIIYIWLLLYYYYYRVYIYIRIYNSVRELRKIFSLCSIVISLDRQLSILPRSVTFGRELPQVDSTWTHGSSGIQPQETRETLVDNGKRSKQYEKRERSISNDQNFESSIAADRKSSLRNTTATALHPPKPGQKNMEKPQPPYLV